MNNEFVYEVREITIGGEYAFDRVDSEYVFSTFRKATNYIKKLAKGYSEQSDYKTHILNIIRLEVNNPGNWKSTIVWEYDIKGKLIRTLDYSEDYEPKDKSLEYRQKFDIGEIVKVRGLPWNQYSHFGREYIGVIAMRPDTIDDWIKAGNSKDEWDPLYLVDFIGLHGFHDHDHLAEPGIEKFKGKLPNELSFLKTLSKHYKKELCIRADVMKKIYNRDIYLFDVETFSNDYITNPT
jgi:hypothetical protein